MKDSKVVERLTPTKGGEWLTEQFLAIYNLAVPYVKGKTILDAGCGTGLGCSTLLEAGANDIEAFDISEKALRFARKNFGSKRIVFKKADFEKDKFPLSKYDIAISIEVIEHIKNYRFYLDNIALSLKNKGLLFLTTPNAPKPFYNNPYHLRYFTDKEVCLLLKEANFKVIKTWTVSINNFSLYTPILIPVSIISTIKKSRFYPYLIKLFYRPKVKEGDTSGETMFFLARRYE